MFGQIVLRATALLLFVNASLALRPDGDQVAIMAQDSGIEAVDGKLMAISNEKAIFSQYADRYDVDQRGRRYRMIDVNNPTLVPNGGLAADKPGQTPGLLFKWDPPSFDIKEFSCWIQPKTKFLKCELGINDVFAVCLDPQGEFLDPVYYLYSFPSSGPIPSRCHTVNLKTMLGGRTYDN